MAASLATSSCLTSCSESLPLGNLATSPPGADCDRRRCSPAPAGAGGRADVIARQELLRGAYVLGGMVDQYLIMLLFGRDRTLASVSRDRDAVVDTLSLFWERGMEP